MSMDDKRHALLRNTLQELQDMQYMTDRNQLLRLIERCIPPEPLREQLDQLQITCEDLREFLRQHYPTMAGQRRDHKRRTP